MAHDPYKGELSSLRRRAARKRWDALRERLSQPDAAPAPRPVPVAPPPVQAPPQLVLVSPTIDNPKPAPRRRNTPVPTVPISAITRDAVDAYNRILAKPNGVLSVVTEISMDRRIENVRRVIDTAAKICRRQFGDPQITPAFWEQYFTEISHDDFRSGRGSYGNGHANWRPDFEYLTRRDTMISTFEKAVSM